MTEAPVPESLIPLLTQKFGALISDAVVDKGFVVVRVARASMREVFQLLKIDADLRFDMCLSVTAVDWMDSQENRFEVVYHLLSIQTLHRLRVKVRVPEHNPEVDTVTDLWAGANFMEREVWDMYGISFKGNSDQRRILMYDEFKGHPLRKDYPIQAKQPRIPMRAPEVENTARKMVREPLVAIGRRGPSGAARST